MRHACLSAERDRFLDFATHIENANLAFAEATSLPRVEQRVLFRVGAREVWLHSRRFKRLPASAVRTDFDDAFARHKMNICSGYSTMQHSGA